MTRNKFPLDPNDLRKLAENVASKNRLRPERILAPEQADQVFHELRVHQIELEMQNDELRRSHQELEASRDRYFQLFELAPIGYLTINQREVIVEANQSASKMLGIKAGGLIGRPFTHFVLFADDGIFQEHCKRLLESGAMQVFELRLVKRNGTEIWAQMQITSSTEADGQTVFRATLTDINDRKRSQEALQAAYDATEETVKLRTKELQETLADLVRTREEREKLQYELLRISEKEKQLIAQELHDGLCQHLTGTAMLGSVVARNLAQRGDPEASQANQICDLLNMGADEARNLSHGLHPVKAESEGLMEALLVYSGTTSKLFGVECSFRCPEPVKIEHQATATHLFRIAQEAVTNALRHGQATRVVITLSQHRPNTAVTLSIRDNGTGIPGTRTCGPGMGMQVMRYRAEVMGATLKISSKPAGGTVVKCVWSGKGAAPAEQVQKR